MPTCFDVADYFLSKSCEDAGDLISNLKLQKLAYYAQGFGLALLGKPLFEERIEAWMHGPVVPDLYHRYSGHGSAGIPAPANFDQSVFSPAELRLLDEVYAVYGQYSAWKLRELTHEETPWLDNYQEGVMSREIPRDAMAEYFRDNLVA